MKEYKTCEEVLQALKDGKKVMGIGHLRRLCEAAKSKNGIRSYIIIAIHK